MSELIPIFPLNTVLFPEMYLPLHIFEDRYRLMIRHCLETEQLFGVVLIRSGSEVGAPALPHSIGTTARIIKLDAQEDGRYYLVAQGERRFRIQELQPDLPYLRATVEPLADEDTGEDGLSALSREAGIQFKRYIALLLSFADKWIGDFEMPGDPETMSHFIAARLNVIPPKKQRLLEMTSTRLRLAEEMDMMQRESAQLELLAASKTHPAGSGPPS